MGAQITQPSQPTIISVNNMSKGKDSFFRNLAQLSSMGISMVLAIAIGVWFGMTLDRWFGTNHVFFYIFLLIGIAAGFNNIYIMARKEIHKDDDGN